MSTFTTDTVLFALFILSRRGGAIDAGALGRCAGTSALVAAEALIALERAGLVDATRLRLTLSGLARATKLAAADSGWALPPSAAASALPRSAPSPVPTQTARRAREPAVVRLLGQGARVTLGAGDTQH